MKSPGVVLALALSVLAFAVWLKVAPEFTSGHRAGTAQMTKLWVDPTQGWESQVKLAPVVILLFFLAPLISLTFAGEWSRQSVLDLKSAVRDIFAESRHWFRPPPPRS